MTRQTIILVICVFFLFSCKKNDNTKTKVGFYCIDPNSTTTENGTLNLFMDNAFMGKIPVLNYEPSCGDPKMFYLTIDSKKHQMDVKNDEGEYINAEYVQVSENKCASGSGKNSKNVKNGPHGSSFAMKTGEDCATMGFTK